MTARRVKSKAAFSKINSNFSRLAGTADHSGVIFVGCRYDHTLLAIEGSCGRFG